MEDILEKAIKQAEYGRKIWLELVDKYRLEGNFRVVLFPSDASDINTISVKAMRKLSEKVEKLIALSYSQEVLSWDVKESNIILQHFSRKEAEALMRFYSMYEFTDKLIIASLDEPEGRKGKGLIGVKGITLEELVNIGIFKQY